MDTKRRTKRKLKVVEMSVLRKILGVTRRDRKRNVDIMKTLDTDKDIIELLRIRRLTYFETCVSYASWKIYDTIRDAILTCARKPTWISLIYRTEPITKKCKNRKTKSRKQICSEITVNSLGNACSESRRRKRKGCIVWTYWGISYKRKT